MLLAVADDRGIDNLVIQLGEGDRSFAGSRRGYKSLVLVAATSSQSLCTSFKPEPCNLWLMGKK